MKPLNKLLSIIEIFLKTSEKKHPKTTMLIMEIYPYAFMALGVFLPGILYK